MKIGFWKTMEHADNELNGGEVCFISPENRFFFDINSASDLAIRYALSISSFYNMAIKGLK